MTKSLIKSGVLAGLLGAASAFYMPGVKPLTFQEGDEVPMKVNAMTSIHTQLPKDYYRLPFCQPEGGPRMASENLGEFLTGNKVQSSAYTINMMREVYCQILCQIQLTKLEARNLKMHIRYGYHNNWIIDNLPSASVGLSDAGEKQKHYAGGFPIGFVDAASGEKRDAYVYNHVNINVEYHKPATGEEGYRVVGFAVEPMSVQHQFLGGYDWDGTSVEGYTKGLESCRSGVHMDRSQIQANQIVEEGQKVIYTYDVVWRESGVAWSSRWDVYLSEDHMIPAQVHWYSITNSILVVLFLSLLIVSILVRNLRRDIAGYNAVAALTEEEKEEEMDETGWKLVHADVFRPPTTRPMLFCVFVGSGAQLCTSAFFAIALSAVGFLSPARRGSLMIAVLVLYMLCGALAGYVSSRLYKSFRGRAWQMCTLFTATLFPGTVVGVFLFFNIILAFFHSSGSVPFVDVIIVLAMWCCVSIPLVFLGAYFGYKADAISYPTVTSTIARAIPEPTLMLNPYLAMALAGMVPFAAAYVELFFIMTSLWMDQFYYVFGFTLIVYLILLITCAEVTVLLCYYQLCGENHRWWWFSFFTAGSTAFYMFVYSAFWFKSLEASKMMITYMLYFGYMFLISYAMFLVTGMVGAMSCLWFTRKIFGSIKVD
eukprot:CAMPEP_0197466734 /NCGR_PEP_ID=MMETSP1175-20131217/65205_1 /TAXON_ID=1003142 /ORGANISM="Triceratium dubium, Strain CCMP147" /LENGTH=652 /DNA_ID=CAMNT_0043002787 /DNA_START=181 /DNA_END=2139 /DNA_ORIENTATION=-